MTGFCRSMSYDIFSIARTPRMVHKMVHFILHGFKIQVKFACFLAQKKRSCSPAFLSKPIFCCGFNSLGEAPILSQEDYPTSFVVVIGYSPRPDVLLNTIFFER